jgi:hypothetical protein
MQGAEQLTADIVKARENTIGDVVVSDSDDEEAYIITVPDQPPAVKPMKRVSRNMVRALMGVAYDLNHWKDLPPQKSRLSTGETLKFVVGRDNRPLYIVMLIAFFVFIIALMVGIACLSKKAHRRHKRKKLMKDLQQQAFLQYQMRSQMPPQLQVPSYEASLMGGRKW